MGTHHVPHAGKPPYGILFTDDLRRMAETQHPGIDFHVGIEGGPAYAHADLKPVLKGIACMEDDDVHIREVGYHVSDVERVIEPAP